MKNPHPLILAFLFFCCSLASKGQAVSLALKSSPNVNLQFDTMEKYRKGIILPAFLTLNVEATGTEWDLYVGTTTSINGFFDVISSYSTTGNTAIPVSILQARVHNSSNTSQTSTSFFNLSDLSNPVYVIGSAGNDVSIPCGTTGANGAGSYSSQPSCYSFKVDLKATPGFDYRAGLYSLRVDFILVQDL